MDQLREAASHRHLFTNHSAAMDSPPLVLRQELVLEAMAYSQLIHSSLSHQNIPAWRIASHLRRVRTLAMEDRKMEMTSG